MADFSEHIWIDPYDGSQTIRPDGIHYVRADLYDTVTAERDAALARAERAEKALEQAIQVSNISLEPPGNVHSETFQTEYTEAIPCDAFPDLADYLKAKENQ